MVDSQPAPCASPCYSASWPDPEADRGFHEFTYASILIAAMSAHTVKRGYELNLLQVMLLPPISSPTSGKLPTIGRF